MVIRYDPTQPQTHAKVIEPFDAVAPWAGFAFGGAVLTFGVSKLWPWRWE